MGTFDEQLSVRVNFILRLGGGEGLLTYKVEDVRPAAGCAEHS